MLVGQGERGWGRIGKNEEKEIDERVGMLVGPGRREERERMRKNKERWGRKEGSEREIHERIGCWQVREKREEMERMKKKGRLRKGDP